MKKFLSLPVFCLLLSSAWGQCNLADCLASELITYYLDLDGDGIGVDIDDWNVDCCAPPSDMYVTTAGDVDPSDPNDATTYITGCTYYGACNYNKDARRNDGSCLFPLACQICLEITPGTKVVDGTGIVYIAPYVEGGAVDTTGPCSCDETNPSLPLGYEDALGNCFNSTQSDYCAADSDNDGVCDDVDPCLVPGETLDDCNVCGTNTAATFITFENANGEPCIRGTVGCTDQNDKCSCENANGATYVFDACGTCGGSGAATGYNCQGDCDDVLGLDPTTGSPTGNGVCDFEEVFGCMDDTKCNYSVNHTIEHVPSSCQELDACGNCGGSGFPEDANGVALCDCDGTPPAFGKTCAGLCINDSDNDGICDEFEIVGCTNALACNYMSNATDDDGCIVKDALLVCGGPCVDDVDNDGICDDNGNDPCTTGSGFLDECGVCEGTSEFTLEDNSTPCVPGTPGCTNSSNHCDCSGSIYDIVNVCGGNCLADADQDGICDLDADGSVADRFICISQVVDFLGNCIEAGETPCSEGSDSDGDGLCDHDTDGDGIAEDPCPTDPDNLIDECGECGDIGIPAGHCDCNSSVADILGVCGGTCLNDIDGDGICDDEDPCISITGTGIIDECGICEGTSFFKLSNDEPCDPGTPGCTNILGHCNCDGAVLDALDVCGGTCSGDADSDGICDFDELGQQIDLCIGSFDACGVCNGDGAIYDCGCAGIPEGMCDCFLNILDECDECGGTGPDFGLNCNGTCVNDVNDNGICDEFEEMPITQVLYLDPTSEGPGNQMNYFTDHTKLQKAMDEFSYLHHLMSENLDDGSLTGSTRVVTIEKSILDKGTLDVMHQATFNTNMHLKASLALAGNLYISGSATIGGATLARNGMVTSDMAIAGNASIGGNVDVGIGMNVDGRTQLRNKLDISNDFTVYKVPGASEELAFAVEASTGNINVKGAFKGASNLNIDGFSDLDRLDVEDHAVLDHAIVNNPLIVQGNAEWQGNLDVGDGVLTVNSINGNTFILEDMNVGGNVTVNGNAHVLGTATIGGTTFANGGIETTWLDVKGDMNVQGEGEVGLSMTVGTDVNVYGAMGIQSNFEIIQGTTGNVKFDVQSATGNVTSAGNLDAKTLLIHGTSSLGGTINVANALTANGTVAFDGNLRAANQINLKDAQFKSTLTSTGNLATAGYFKTGGLVTTNSAVVTGAKAELNGLTTLISTNDESIVNVISSGPNAYVAEFQNTISSGHGITIQSGMTTPGNANNYVTFRNGAGTTMGRIEGVLKAEYPGDGEYDYSVSFNAKAQAAANVQITLATLSAICAGFDVVKAIADVVAAATSTTTCVGNGVCQTIPVPSLIIVAAANAVTAAIGVVTAVQSTNAANKSLSDLEASKTKFDTAINNSIASVANAGVTFQSGAGDYAEWLPKSNPREDFEPGQIVGVRDGKISLDTENSDYLFAISTIPIVLGNAPDKTWKHEKVAFLGQVPVRVRGSVQAGDFILASGHSDGYGIAVSSNDLKSKDFSNIVGVAWEAGNNAFNTVNVAIGMSNVLADAASKMESQVEQLEKETAAMKIVASALIQDVKPSLLEMQSAGIILPLIGELTSVQDLGFAGSEMPEVSGIENLALHDLTDEGMQLAFEEALELIDFDSMNPSTRSVWDQLQNSEELRTEFLTSLESQIKHQNQKTIQKILRFSGKASLNKVVPASQIKADMNSRNSNPAKKQ